MIKLSKRMNAVASMVTDGNVLADVGTDHGYVPIALVQKGKITKAIAMDINKGPLQRANEHIRSCRLENMIETRLSDGVEALDENEADTILIAGMGGELVIHILTDGEKVCRKAKELILQPQSDIDHVRRYLRENKYRIIDEDMVFEEGKYYPMMKVIPVGEELTEWQDMESDVVTACDIYGPLLIKNGNPVLRRFLVKQHRQLRDILKKLEEQPQNEGITKRITEIKKELEYNESAYTILGAIKDAGI